MNFLIDAHPPPKLARRLSELGHASAHIADWLPHNAPDPIIWRLAVERCHIIVTKDADYLQFAQSGGGTTPLLWLRVGNGSVARVIALVESHLPAIEAALSTGQLIIEIR